LFSNVYIDIMRKNYLTFPNTPLLFSPQRGDFWPAFTNSTNATSLTVQLNTSPDREPVRLLAEGAGGVSSIPRNATGAQIEPLLRFIYYKARGFS